MSTTYSRTTELDTDRAPRPALWCHATAGGLCANPTTVVHLCIDELAVAVPCWGVGRGRVSVRVGPAWRWPADAIALVGELELTDGLSGLSLVGWWSPGADESDELVMDVVGLTLWNSTRLICTEDHARISALLA